MKIMPHEIELAKQDHGKRRTLREVARDYGISATCLANRLHRHPDLTIEEAASIPPRFTHQKVEPARELSVKEQRLARLRKEAARNGVPWKRALKRLWHGWDERKAVTAPYTDHEERGRRGGTRSFQLYGQVACGHRSAFYRAVKNAPSCQPKRKDAQQQ